ncbi:hypothetical protein GE09DRAFT_981810 [Coniochaeta sp. 2T2.1]|nr:hypothetical protein GE09DRAFT_981810 [Coniochaeta sp. 2T2.1]
MFFPATTIFLLVPVLAAASSLIPRQPAPQARFVGTFTATSGCGAGASLSIDATGQVATVLLPNYSVTLPGSSNEKRCSVTLPVLFPSNACTSGTARGTVTGQVRLPSAGVQATFNGRAYAVSPSPGSVTDVSPDGSWTGPVDERYTLSDEVGYTLRPDANNNVVSFTLQGGLQVQPSNAPEGFISNDRFVFDIATQIPCCEYTTCTR